MNEELLYFIDYDEDQVLPRSGNINLVNQYVDKMKEAGTPIIGIHKTKQKMMEDALEFAHQARHGADKYKRLSDEELTQMINEL